MSSRRRIALLALFIILTFALMVVDLIREPVFPGWGEFALDVSEKVIFMLAMGVVAWMVHSMIDLRESQAALTNNVARSLAQGDAWRAQRSREIAALGQAIHDEFRKWHLTEAEIDVAGLMLKGASQKEIALARDTTEATIRQQAQSVYRKSGLSGRTELSAYFLESLFVTAEENAAQKPGLSVVS